MTRRITLIILLTVWATLVVGGLAAYLTVRAVMLADLDRSLMERALAFPEIRDDSGDRYIPLPDKGDYHLVQDDDGRTISRTAPQSYARRDLLAAAFAPNPDGGRFRTITLRTLARPVGGGDPVPITISYRGSAADFDRLLTRLAWALGISGVLCGVLAAGLARLAAVGALRPLQSTAQVIGTIDEASLDRRIDAAVLPPELQPVAHRLNDMLARLEQSARERKRFIADASHELRTPVAALIMGIEVALRRPRDPAQYRATLESCLTDARLLRRLAETLLDQVRSELISQQSRPANVDLVELIHECVTALRPLADNRGIRIDIHTPEQLHLHTDPDRIRAILLNLVGNAIEYDHPDGTITILTSATGGDVQLSVADTGPGIAPDQLERIFEPFYRADPTRGDGHLGLGLYLVRTHARALGGNCAVESEPGNGTTFLVHFPAAGRDAVATGILSGAARE